MENEIENARHPNRVHPYKSPYKSPNTGLKITHNFFSFANNTTSLFPQQQRQPLGNLKKVSAQTGTKTLTSTACSTMLTNHSQSQRQPFQELNSNHAASFMKIPSSFKLSESSITLLEESKDKAEKEIHDATISCQVEDKPDIEMSEIRISPSRQSHEEEHSLPPHYPDYCVDILSNWNNSQYRSRPRKYMDKQKDISFRMRSILIDWLVEVALEFDTLQETLFLSTNIIDRFLSRMSVPKSKLQLIGTARLEIPFIFSLLL